MSRQLSKGSLIFPDKNVKSQFVKLGILFRSIVYSNTLLPSYFLIPINNYLHDCYIRDL